MLYPYPRSFVALGIQILQMFRVRVFRPTQFTEVLYRVIPGVNTPGMVMCAPYGQKENRKFAYGCGCRTELTDVPGTGVRLYRTPSSSGYTGNIGVKTRLERAKKQLIDW